MEVRQLHRTVLVRLALAWLLLSAALGAGAVYVEMRKADALMLQLATARAAAFLEHVGALDPADPSHREALRRGAREALNSGFAAVRVYDAGQRLVTEALDRSTDADLAPHVHALERGDLSHYHTHWSGRRPSMQVLLPIETERARLGYFEGVYRVDAATAEAMVERFTAVLVLVVAVIFATAAALYPIVIFLNRELAAHVRALLRSNVELMEVLGSAVALRDSDTHLHNYRVTVYAVRLAQALDLGAAEIRRLIAGAFLHDVGKIGVSDAILLKPGPLSADETVRVRTHVVLGTEVLSNADWLQSARDVVECHHERFDGSGYPNGLKGAAIPLNARIFAIADVFDALTSRRPYKEALPLAEALAAMRRASGSHFDPALFPAFEALASRLYREAHAAAEAALRAMLRELVARYFLHGSPGSGTGQAKGPEKRASFTWKRALVVALFMTAGSLALAQATPPGRNASAAAMSAMTPGLLQTAEETVFFLRISGELQLAEEQHAALLEIFYEFQKQRLQRIADMNVAEAELERLLTRDAIDLAAVKAKVAESASIAAALKLAQIESLLRAMKILTHEQHLKVMLLRQMPKEGTP